MTARSSSAINEGLFRSPSEASRFFYSAEDQKPIRYDKPPTSVLNELYDGKPVMASTVGSASQVMLNHRDARRSSMTDLSGPIFGDARAQRDYGTQAKEAW
ncbi:hypothetical protein HDV00_006426 [Rhizophlyctis rosea]|nr:hypothetical protein HDV00_006426 [Rhizophlyctis rosea]